MNIYYDITQKYIQVTGDTSIPTLTGGVVRDLDWTKAVLVKKSHNQKHYINTFRFSGVFKKTPIFPSQSLCEKLP